MSSGITNKNHPDFRFKARVSSPYITWLYLFSFYTLRHRVAIYTKRRNPGLGCFRRLAYTSRLVNTVSAAAPGREAPLTKWKPDIAGPSVCWNVPSLSWRLIPRGIHTSGKTAMVHPSLLIKNALQSLAQSCQLFTLISHRKQIMSMLLLLFFNVTCKTLVFLQLHFSLIKGDMHQLSYPLKKQMFQMEYFSF